MTQQLRIALVAPPSEPVPPPGYGGTERIVAELAEGLLRRGHQVTTFCSGDSTVGGERVITVPQALRPAGLANSEPWKTATATMAIERANRGEFDIVHGHLDLMTLLIAPACPVPVIATFHGRIDHPAIGVAMRGTPAHLVAISKHQAGTRPEADWAAVIHNGLMLNGAPFERRRDDSLVFAGRVAPEKGIVDAIEVAKRSGRPLRIIAKVGTHPEEAAYAKEVFEPALASAGSLVEFLGEVSGEERDQLVASSYATLMPSAWPEPFGLVAIESLACGTPVITRRVGGLPEIIREGIDGFFGDDVTHMASLVERAGRLDREAIRASAIDRFSAERMTEAYEKLMLRLATSKHRGMRPLLRVAASRAAEAAAGAPAPTDGDAPARLDRAANGDADWGLPVASDSATEP
ncbi:MAG: glycosyltransferase family 4 protein [Chloroflexota bacterium]